MITEEEPWVTNIRRLARSGRDDELLTRQEVASLLKCSTQTVDRMRQAGELTTIRIRDLVRFKMSEVSEIMERGI